MTLMQVLQQVMDHYPSLKTASIQVERAQQEQQKVESQLGWMLSAQAGVSRDISAWGSATDRLALKGGLARTLESGETLSLGAGLNRDIAASASAPQAPNPSTATSLDLSYRIPLAQGEGNPLYEQGLAAADAGVTVANADRLALYDQLASQLIDIYMSAAITRARIDNINRAISRTLRLQRYIQQREEFGISEEKDLLQVQAELSSRRAELKGLEMAWQQQRIALNRLMGRRWDAALEPVVIRAIVLATDENGRLLQQVTQHSPELRRLGGRLQVAESVIKSMRDARQDELDLVLFAGTETRYGNASSGQVDDSDLVGGVRIEFERGVDKRGVDADLYQAQLDRHAIHQERKQVMEDLGYDLSSLLAEIRAGQQALQAYRRSVKDEQKKLDEAGSRYRAGRTDTDQLIQFESRLAEAELALELQQVEIARRYRKLVLLRGDIWTDVRLPEYSFPVQGE
jgi:outer membrane protein TolC